MRNSGNYTYVIRPDGYAKGSGFHGGSGSSMRRVGKITFSQKELKDIGISVLVLTAAFTIILSGRGNTPLLAFLTAAGAVVSGFFLHEMGHKFTAQRYGCWAEFRTWNMGLLMALVTAMVGFLFAAPGAVYIAGSVNTEKNGKISLAGPMTNLVVAVCFLAAAFIVTSPTIVFVLVSIAFLNTFLGMFNMLPFPPLDGSKIIRWSKPVYAVTLVVLVGLYLATTQLSW